MSRCDELEYTLDWPIGCELQIHHTSFCPSGQKGAENSSGFPSSVTKGNARVNKTCVPWSESNICLFQILQNTRGSTTPWSLTDFPLDYSTRGATSAGEVDFEILKQSSQFASWKTKELRTMRASSVGL